ncbi:MAG: energy transducer TonB [Acidobacteriota bacterium]
MKKLLFLILSVPLIQGLEAQVGSSSESHLTQTAEPDYGPNAAAFTGMAAVKIHLKMDPEGTPIAVTVASDSSAKALPLNVVQALAKYRSKPTPGITVLDLTVPLKVAPVIATISVEKSAALDPPVFNAQSAPSAAAPPSSSNKPGTRTKVVNPVYPSEAKAKRIQGKVVLMLTIHKDGTTGGLGLVSGPILLAEEAFRVVSQWEYQPYVLDGKLSEAMAEVTVNFVLDLTPSH